MPIIFAFGASKGIGSVFCKKAIEKGYKIVLFARTNPYDIKSDFVSVDFLNEDDFLM
ncbi:TPA: SDR family NAD(P)-dependent oxidoreductase, partial [Campylobacter fetus]|nr:SDR family NAD(P)-dependent oxidoreductase [Campylobacter fetus]